MSQPRTGSQSLVSSPGRTMQAVLSGVHSVCSPQSIAEEHSLGPGAETVTHWLLVLHARGLGLQPRTGSQSLVSSPGRTMQAVLSGVHSVCSPQSIAEEHSLGPGAETVTHWLLALHSV